MLLSNKSSNVWDNRSWYSINKHTLLHKKTIYTCSYFEVFICSYNVKGEIDKLSTNTCRYAAQQMFTFLFTYLLELF